jgi:hypothetical protein
MPTPMFRKPRKDAKKLDFRLTNHKYGENLAFLPLFFYIFAFVFPHIAAWKLREKCPSAVIKNKHQNESQESFVYNNGNATVCW